MSCPQWQRKTDGLAGGVKNMIFFINRKPHSVCKTLYQRCENLRSKCNIWLHLCWICFSELSSGVPLPPAPSIYGCSLSGSHRGGLTQATGCVFLWGFPSQSYENTGFCCWYAGLVRLLGNMWVMNWLYVLHKSSYFMTKKKSREKELPYFFQSSYLQMSLT